MRLPIDNFVTDIRLGRLLATAAIGKHPHQHGSSREVTESCLEEYLHQQCALFLTPSPMILRCLRVQLCVRSRRHEDPYLYKTDSRNALSVVYSPDGQTLYMTTSDQNISAVSSDGDTIHWYTNVGDSDLCDIAVSPDGWSVRSCPQTSS